MTCVPGPHGQRIIRGRHLDTCGDPTQCAGCEPCPDPHCRTCRKDHAAVTCPGCLAMVRGNLAAVHDLAGHLVEEAVHGRAALHTHDGVPGGDALVLLAPGHYTPGGHHLELEGQATDPRPPLAVLSYWARVWSDVRGHYPEAHGLDQVVAYLDTQLHHMAEEGDLFPRLARDVGRTRTQVENVLHAGVRPDTTRVPCWDCGTRLEKVWASTEREDHWRCPKCGEVYDRGRYDRAKYDHLASTGAERYVHVTDAVAAVGRPEQTVRSWIRKGLVSTQRHPTTGRLMAWWPDVRSLHLNTATRKGGRSGAQT